MTSRAAAVAFTVAFVAAACGGAGPSGVSSAVPLVAATHNASGTADPLAAARADLAPTGTLRVAVSDDPPFLAQKDASGQFHGLAIDLAATLATSLRVPLSIVTVDNVDNIIDASRMPTWDVAFLPALPPTVAAADLSTFALVQHTYAVRPGSAIKTVSSADQAGMKIATVGTTGHSAVLAMRIKYAQIVYANDPPSAIQLLKSGSVDAFAFGRPQLAAFGSALAGYPILDDDWFVAELALATHRGSSAGLPYARQFVETAKSSGLVQRSIDQLMLNGVKVAPASSGS